MMKKAQQGFTLIELMIVVAIVGILAALALPAYQDYVVRSKISEGLARGAEAKTSVAEYYSANSTIPADTAAAGFNSMAAGYVNSVKCDSSATPDCRQILVEFDGGSTGISALGSNDTVAFSVSAISNGIIEWKCKAPSSAGIVNKYLPASCR